PNVHCLRYEDLIQNTPKKVKILYEKIGLKYDDSVLNTNNNSKYKGRFGDPFQNSDNGYSKSKAKAGNKKLSLMHKKFLRGYSDYLGEFFLHEYGNYELTGNKPRKTITFSRFLHFRTGYDLQRELKFLL